MRRICMIGDKGLSHGVGWSVGSCRDKYSFVHYYLRVRQDGSGGGAMNVQARRPGN